MSDGAEYAALINTYVEEEEQEEAREGEPDTDVLLEVASSRSVPAAGTGNPEPRGGGVATSPGHAQGRDTFIGSLRVAADKIQTLDIPL